MQNKIDKITDILRRDDGISGAMHYTEQISWILFLKFLDDYEEELKLEAILNNQEYKSILGEKFSGRYGQHQKQAKKRLILTRL